MAAIAGVFCPSTFVATSVASKLRLATISGGGTVAAKAVSYAPTAAVACAAACCACSPVAPSHVTYGAAAAAIEMELGPVHGPLARVDKIEP